jgi:transposase-like protein
MPLTATLEDIKAYQQKVEKDKISPHHLPPCSRCSVDSSYFKIHAYRQRRFLIIIEMLIKAAYCSLVRFICPGCGKTFTFYPDFTIPHKHYTRQTIESFSRAYVENDQKTYQDAVMTDDGVPERAVSGRMLAASSIHRWIGTLAELIRADQDALKKLLQEKLAAQLCRHFGPIQIPEKKYKTSHRRHCLLRCRWFFRIQAVLKNSAFTEFAIRSA